MVRRFSDVGSFWFDDRTVIQSAASASTKEFDGEAEAWPLRLDRIFLVCCGLDDDRNGTLLG